MNSKKRSTDYHDYVIKNGEFIGDFELMYQNIDDPWHIGDAEAIQYDLALYLLNKYNACPQQGNILTLDLEMGLLLQD